MKRLFIYLKLSYKIVFKKPIYRVDVLNAVKYNYQDCQYAGICESIAEFMNRYAPNVIYTIAKKIFPKLNFENAKRFNTSVKIRNLYGYYWSKYDWKHGRMQFLNWLISEYKNDKEDLRYFKYE